MDLTMNRAELMCFVTVVLLMSSSRASNRLRSLLRSAFPLKPDSSTSSCLVDGTIFSREKNIPKPLPPPSDMNRSRLLKILGKFHPEIMSIEKPQHMGLSLGNDGRTTKKKLAASMPTYLKKLRFTIPGSHRKFGHRTSRKLRLWLWNVSSCGVNTNWMDFGPYHWPRYINVRQCSSSSCSYPTGMRCKAAAVKKLDLLMWYCPHVEKRSRRKLSRSCRWIRYSTCVIEKCGCACM